MRFLFYLLLLMVVILGLAFAILNAHSVNFNYYVGSKQLPLSLLLVFTLGIGVIVGLLAGLVAYIKLWFENSRLRRTVKRLEKISNQLQTVSSEGSH